MQPLVFLYKSGSRRNFKMRFGLFLTTLTAHFLGSLIQKFPAVTLWRPLEHMSVAIFFIKFCKNHRFSSIARKKPFISEREQVTFCTYLQAGQKSISTLVDVSSWFLDISENYSVILQFRTWRYKIYYKQPYSFFADISKTFVRTRKCSADFVQAEQIIINNRIFHVSSSNRVISV